MGDADKTREVAARTYNFGYLLPLEEILVLHGASIESYVFTDPNVSMIKARLFGESLATALFLRLGLPSMPDTQHQRVRVLLDQGVIEKRVHGWFDAVRRKGNQAAHQGYAAQRDALLLLRSCYELGAWFYRLIRGSYETPPFVPPQPPEKVQSGSTDRQAFDELHDLLRQYRQELVDTLLKIDQQTTLAEARATAQKTANQEILDAVQSQSYLRSLVPQIANKVDRLQDQLTQRALTAPTIESAERDELITRSVAASRASLNEVQVRRVIDRMLRDAGWMVQDQAQLDVHAVQGVAVREVTVGRGRADYLLYVDAKLVGVIEAKREGVSLLGVGQQSRRYAEGLDASQRLAAWRVPLPFQYESTGVETLFTNTLDPLVRPRRVFSFHQPATIARWMRETDPQPTIPTFRARLQNMPLLLTDGLRPAQIEAINGLEASLARDRLRALIQMATGAGKTFTMVNEVYRLFKFAGAKRVLFLVDRNNLGRQAEAEFRNFITPDSGDRFAKSYNVQRLTSTNMLGSTNVVISTVQRMFSLLSGQEFLSEDAEDTDDYQGDEPIEVKYNRTIPPETFDMIVVDECHRSIYGRWRAVLEYFDTYLVGLTATPVPQTFGFFRGNLVSQYTYRQAVADGVNVDYEVLRIRTDVGEQGGSIPANTPVRIVDLHTRRERYEPLDTSLNYNADQIGRSVMNPSQIRTAIQAFADQWPSFFPHRNSVPKTLIFAKTDKHADDIVEIVREIFNADTRFCTKITYRADDPEQLLKDFRNDARFRIAVTVDMISTGTDVRPLECVFFLRGVSSATYFEQMKGRGARTIDADEFQAITPGGRAKEKFLLVDAVGVTDSPLVDAKPLQPASQRQVSLEKLLNHAASQGISLQEAEALSSRLGALDKQITPIEREELAALAGGVNLISIAHGLERATDADVQEAALQRGGQAEQRQIILDAVRPLASNPELRRRILTIRRKYDLPYDEYTQDRLVSAEARHMSEDTSRNVVDDWRQYLEQHRDEITALRLVFETTHRDPHKVYMQLKGLASKIADPPHRWTPEILWQAYKKLGVAKGNGRAKGVLELIAILRYELGMDTELRSFGSRVEDNLANWLARQKQAGAHFTSDQHWWIERIAFAVANRLTVTGEDLDGAPFTERGGVDGFLRDFGNDRAVTVLDELNKELPA